MSTCFLNNLANDFAENNLNSLLKSFNIDSFTKLTTNQKISVLDDLNKIAANEQFSYMRNALVAFPLLILAIGFRFARNFCDSHVYLHKKNAQALDQLVQKLYEVRVKGKNLREKERNIYAFGDVHGQLTGFQDNLKRAKLIDENNDWVRGNHDLCIQDGDVVDRGPFSRESWEFLRKIQDQAAREGGKVVRLIGNHELAILEGNFNWSNYLHPERLAQEIKAEILSKKVKLAYSDGISLFVHAGLRSTIRNLIEREIVQDREGLLGWKKLFFNIQNQVNVKEIADHLNDLLIYAVKNDDFSHVIFQIGRSRGGYAEVGGPLWTDIQEMKETTKALQFPQIIAHNPPGFFESPIRVLRNKRLICIDTGLCAFLNNGFIKIHGKSLEVHQKVRSIWNLFLWKKWTVSKF